jgi:hypothetical protein
VPQVLGRISGPLLKANLVRDNVNLSFRNGIADPDILFLDVNNNRIGVNSSTPLHDLDVNGYTRTTDLEVTNQLDIGTITVTGNTISSSLDTITFAPSGGEPTIYQARFQVDDVQIQGNVISTEVSNSNLVLRANGTGTINLIGNTNITGNLNVTGNISAIGNVTIGGNIVIGDSLTDSVTINASIRSDLVPQTDNTYDLGSSAYRWRNLYVGTLFTNVLNLTSLDVGNLKFYNNEIGSTTGQDIIIDGNGAGGVRLGNFRIVDNVVTNFVSGAITEIIQSGTGYFRIQGTNGFVPPIGTDIQRPNAYAVIGMVRYNTDSKALEVWDGTDWASPAGASGAVSEGTANEIAATYALILG